ncbi:MAG: superoxide dismutase family protein [Bacteroidota bacterium]
MSRFLLSLSAAALLLTGCAQPEPADTIDPTTTIEEAPAPEPEVAAYALLTATEGNTASGTVMFTPMADGIMIDGTVTGAGNGLHGLHIHEGSECGPDGKAAKGHYNPSGEPHAGPDSDERHVGDLGNIEIATDGSGTYQRLDSDVALDGDASVIGRTVVLHGSADDLSSQPSGDAGPRIACGVIRTGRPPAM